jgi:hypothetical protein
VKYFFVVVEKAHYQTQCGRLTKLEKDFSTFCTVSAFPHQPPNIHDYSFMTPGHQKCINHVKNWTENICTVIMSAAYCTARFKQLYIYWVKAEKTQS